MTIIADSGSTKTTWACFTPTTPQSHHILANSLGINPIRDNEDIILKAIERGREVLYQACQQTDSTPFLSEDVHQVFFYGSGCIPPYSTTVRNLLRQAYPNATILVESDMLGAALALCGHNEGIACILGTGSNSCHFDGTHIVAQTPALGFILGDEGSGASLGKRLVGDILKKQLPADIQQAFYNETELSQSEVINRVYRQPQPNMFLASLTPFLDRHRDNQAVHALIIDEFRRFLQRNIRNYNRPDLPIHFVGGITATFAAELQEAVMQEGMKMGQTLARPITGMVEFFHQL